MSANINTLDLPANISPIPGETVRAASNRIEDRGAVMAAPSPHVLHRDPLDVRTILSLGWTAMLLTLLLLASIALNIWQYWRRPDRIVVDRSSGRVLQINDRDYGETEAVKLGPDRLTNADKQYISGEFIKAVYAIDPATRPRDVERALRMMVPASALKYAKWLKETGTLDKQRAESWQAVWTPQDVSVDQIDPYTVRVIGKQQITKLISGATQQETLQLHLTLKLVADPQRRADRNLRSGFLVSAFDYKELGGGSEASASQ